MKSGILLAVFVLFVSCRLGHDKTDMSRLSVLPSFEILSIDSSTVIHTEQIPRGRPLVFIYFRPDCPHCQKETGLLIDNMDDFKGVHFFLLSGSASFEQLRGFYRLYGISRFSNITVGRDLDHSFFKTFRPASIPYMAIYDGGGRLKKIYEEEVSIQSIISSVDDSNKL